MIVSSVRAGVAPVEMLKTATASALSSDTNARSWPATTPIATISGRGSPCAKTPLSATRVRVRSALTRNILTVLECTFVIPSSAVTIYCPSGVTATPSGYNGVLVAGLFPRFVTVGVAVSVVGSISMTLTALPSCNVTNARVLSPLMATASGSPALDA